MGAEISHIFVDPKHLPQNAAGVVQLLYLFVTYSCVLAGGGYLITRGSELLLLVPSVAGVVGAVVLPVMGALPDALILLFSGLSANAQSSVEVGIGALAGGTTFLLTSLFSLSLYAGRVDIDEHGVGNYKKPKDPELRDSFQKCTKPLLQTGINVDASTRRTVLAMLITAFPMFVIQIPACFARCTLEDAKSDCDTPKWASLAAAVLAGIMFLAYLYTQLQRSDVDEVISGRVRLVQERSLAARIMSARTMFFLDLPSAANTATGITQTSPRKGAAMNASTSPGLGGDGGGGGGDADGGAARLQQQQSSIGTLSAGERPPKLTVPPAVSPAGAPAHAGHAIGEPQEPLLFHRPVQPSDSPVFYSRAKFVRVCKAVFKRVDKNTSGVLEYSDVVPLLAALGEPTDAANVDRMMRELDVDQDGAISLDDFLAVMLHEKKQQELLSAMASPVASADQQPPPPPPLVVGDVTAAPVAAAPAAAAAALPAWGSPASQREGDELASSQNGGMMRRETSSAFVEKVLAKRSGGKPRTGATAAADADGGGGGGAAALQRQPSRREIILQKKMEESSSSDSDVEVPADLSALPPDEQRTRVLLRAAWQMGLGTVLAVVFTDPLVDTLMEIAARFHVAPFYVAFVIAPVVSSAPEVIATYQYAAKRSIRSASISIGSLLGTVAMNNTLCFLVFVLLVFVRDLKWVFTAETAAIIFVELAMFFIAIFYGTKWKSSAIFVVMSLYPMAVALVAVLHAAGLD